jgi:hypothetical protein
MTKLLYDTMVQNRKGIRDLLPCCSTMGLAENRFLLETTSNKVSIILQQSNESIQSARNVWCQFPSDVVPHTRRNGDLDFIAFQA